VEVLSSEDPELERLIEVASPVPDPVASALS
jgi:hypothetical protein